MLETPSSHRSEPVRVGERVVAIDVIRGFALLGVLLMNIQYWFRCPMEAYALAPHPWPGAANAATDTFLSIFMEGKSVSLFSFLFGVGLIIQLERARERGAAFGPYAARRLTALLAFGLLHITLLWVGDILLFYAVVGALLLLFLKRSPRTTFIWSLVLLGLPFLAMTAAVVVRAALHAPIHPRDDTRALAFVEACVRVYGHGSWMEALRFRWHHYTRDLGMLAQFSIYALGLFLLGHSAWRRGVFRDPESHLGLIRKTFICGLAGLALACFAAFWGVGHAIPRDAFSIWIRNAEFIIATPLIALGYAAALLLALRQNGPRRALGILAPLGRMALTNYLAQSVVMTLIYNGYGLGLYDQVGPFAGTLMGLALFAMQIPFSIWWLNRFRFGPMEWVWRCLTYWKLQPFRITA